MHIERMALCNRSHGNGQLSFALKDAMPRSVQDTQSRIWDIFFASVVNISAVEDVFDVNLESRERRG